MARLYFATLLRILATLVWSTESKHSGSFENKLGSSTPQSIRRAGGIIVPLDVLTFQRGTGEQAPRRWLASVLIGEEKKTFNLVFDTGSHATWLMAPNVGPSNTVYNVNEDQIGSCRSVYDLQYAEGARVLAPNVEDTVEFADLSIPQYLFGVATYIIPQRFEAPENGVLALNMEIGTWLSRARSLNPSYAAFTMDVGGLHQEVIFSDSNSVQARDWLPLAPTDPISWKVPSEYGNALFDTGDEVVKLPAALMQQYLALAGPLVKQDRLGARDVYVVQCQAQIPDLSIPLADKVLTIPGRYLVGIGGDNNPKWCLLLVAQSEYLVLGAPAFVSNKITFDSTGNGRIGIDSY